VTFKLLLLLLHPREKLEQRPRPPHPLHALSLLTSASVLLMLTTNTIARVSLHYAQLSPPPRRADQRV
jgi:hypothetical protein